MLWGSAACVDVVVGVVGGLVVWLDWFGHD